MRNVWGTSATDVYVGGLFNLTIIHYDGQEWSTVTSDPDESWPVVTDIWGSSPVNIFASGTKGIIKQFNGNEWHTLSVANENLHSIWGSSSENVFAVGDRGTIFHYDGDEWYQMEQPTNEHLSSIWGSSDTNIFIVGDNGIILHYEGE